MLTNKDPRPAAKESPATCAMRPRSFRAPGAASLTGQSAPCTGARLPGRERQCGPAKQGHRHLHDTHGRQARSSQRGPCPGQNARYGAVRADGTTGCAAVHIFGSRALATDQAQSLSVIGMLDPEFLIADSARWASMSITAVDVRRYPVLRVRR
jgi:hypothetical protein